MRPERRAGGGDAYTGPVGTLGRAEPFTVADLEHLPHDGRRYELVDGLLVVTPAPHLRHQRVLGRLYLLLAASCPTELEVLFAPVDWRISRHTQLQPDLLVFPRAPVDAPRLERPPLLVVEVLSPSTRAYDHGTKRLAYAAGAAASYWIVDADRPSVTVLALRDGTYDEVAVARGGESVALDQPFPVTVIAADLVG